MDINGDVDIMMSTYRIYIINIFIFKCSVFFLLFCVCVCVCVIDDNLFQILLTRCNSLCVWKTELAKK